jgi:hypothetical protein
VIQELKEQAQSLQATGRFKGVVGQSRRIGVGRASGRVGE